MKKIVLTTIALIGLYAFLRNNILMAEGQIIYRTNPEIFYKTFIPLQMVASSICSFIRNNQVNYFYLSFFVLFIDSINRLAVLINHYYQYLTYEYIPSPVESAKSITVRINILPSHIMLFIEIVLIFILFRYFLSQSRVRMPVSS
jgi:hypothetical protein